MCSTLASWRDALGTQDWVNENRAVELAQRSDRSSELSRSERTGDIAPQQHSDTLWASASTGYAPSRKPKSRGESECKWLNRKNVTEPPKPASLWHLRANDPVTYRQQMAKEQSMATSRHQSRSLNLIPEALRPVMTVVSRSSWAKWPASANARFTWMDSNSCMRCTRISTPEVRYNTHPT